MPIPKGATHAQIESRIDEVLSDLPPPGFSPRPLDLTYRPLSARFAKTGLVFSMRDLKLRGQLDCFMNRIGSTKRTNKTDPARRARSRWSSCLAAWMIFCVSSNSHALDFTTNQLVYLEDFEGEVSYPLTPETDVHGKGPLNTFLVPPGTRLPLTGSSALISLVDVVNGAYQGYTTGSGSASLTDDVGLRVVYDSATFASDGMMTFGTAGLFDGGPETLIAVGANLEITESLGTTTGTLSVVEGTGLVGGGVATITSIAIPTADAVAVLSGAEFSVDVLVDRAANTALGSVDVSGGSTTTSSVLGLTVLSSGSLAVVVTLADAQIAPPTSSSVELAEVATYVGYNPVFVPSLFGGSLGALVAGLV